MHQILFSTPKSLLPIFRFGRNLNCGTIFTFIDFQTTSLIANLLCTQVCSVALYEGFELFGLDSARVVSVEYLEEGAHVAALYGNLELGQHGSHFVDRETA